MDYGRSVSLRIARWAGVFVIAVDGDVWAFVHCGAGKREHVDGSTIYAPTLKHGISLFFLYWAKNFELYLAGESDLGGPARAFADALKEGMEVCLEFSWRSEGTDEYVQLSVDDRGWQGGTDEFRYVSRLMRTYASRLGTLLANKFGDCEKEKKKIEGTTG